MEHQIVRKTDSVSKHQNPYKTTHRNKDKSERIHQETFKSGPIQHSRNFVKEKWSTKLLEFDYVILYKKRVALSSGVHEIYSTLETIYLWPHVKNGVDELVRQSDICQRNKSGSNLQQSIPPPYIGLYLFLKLSNVEAVWMAQRQSAIRMFKENLKMGKQRTNFFENQKRCEREFQVGELVYLKLQLFGQNSVSLCGNLKLLAKYYSSCEILQRIGVVAYKLAILENSRIHHEILVSLLKDVIPSLEFSATDANGYDKIAPSPIVKRRTIIGDGQEVSYVQIKWGNGGNNATNREDFTRIHQRFPTFAALCRQGSNSGGGIFIGMYSIELDFSVLEQEGVVWNGRKVSWVLVQRAHDDCNVRSWENRKQFRRIIPNCKDPWGQGSHLGRSIIMTMNGSQRFGKKANGIRADSVLGFNEGEKAGCEGDDNIIKEKGEEGLYQTHG